LLRSVEVAATKWAAADEMFSQTDAMEGWEDSKRQKVESQVPCFICVVQFPGTVAFYIISWSGLGIEKLTLDFRVEKAATTSKEFYDNFLACANYTYYTTNRCTDNALSTLRKQQGSEL
jgi:hypothetical protein